MFTKFLKYSIVAVYFLIFIGSVVRSTGSGMGCPDWPTCFGSYIPPSSEADLRKDYREYFTDIRQKKNEKLAYVFSLLGLSDVLEDKADFHTTYEDIEYSAFKAWIEYINRLIGVIVGFLVLGVFITSLKFLKSTANRYLFFLSLFSMVLLLVQAYLGSIVVSSNLFPGLISLHMFLALLLLGVLIYMMFSFKYRNNVVCVKSVPKYLIWLSLIVIIFSALQLFLGVQVRESVDFIHHELNIYSGVIQLLDYKFYVHRSFSLIIIALNVWLVFCVYRYGLNNPYVAWVIPIIIMEVFAGVALGYFDLTPFAQPFHLLLSTVLIGMQFLCFLYIKFVANK